METGALSTMRARTLRKPSHKKRTSKFLLRHCRIVGAVTVTSGGVNVKDASFQFEEEPLVSF